MADVVMNRARRRRARRRRVAALGVGVVVVAGGGSAALAATAGGATQPVTTTAVIGSVTQNVEASGTVDSSAEVSAAFATNGTVNSVRVKAGQQVSKGQVLATLATGSLQSNVDSATATIATAKQKLEADKTGQTSALSGAGSSRSLTGTGGAVTTDSAGETPLPGQPTTGSATSTGKAATSHGTPSGTLSQLLARITAGQQQVLTAQQAVDGGQAGVDTAQQTVDKDVVQNTSLRDAQQGACTDSGTSGGSPSAACTSARADYAAYADTLSADMAILDKAITAQDGNVSALDAAVTSLDSVLKQLPAAVTSASSSGASTSGRTTAAGSGGSTRPTGGSTQSSQGSATRQTTSQPASTDQPASASQLAADQASIDAAEAELEVAQQKLAAATLTSPLTGTVATVGFTAGSASNGQSIAVLGTGNQIVTINVPLSEIDQVKVGQPASLAVDGHAATVHGAVTRIGLLSSTSGSLTTFPVTVTLADDAPKLYDGVGADVTITTGSASNAVLVPNSAISTVGTRHTVTIVWNGNATTTRVTVGLVGADASQITAGLKAGDEVRLAEPGRALPSSATSTTTNARRFGGAFLGRFAGGRVSTFGGGG